VGATSPGRAVFQVRAFRSVSGRVLTYDTTASRYVPVVGAQVHLREPGLTTATDPLGRYLFRDLAAGSYTISVQSDIPTDPRTIRLGAQPVDLANVDFQIGQTSAPRAPEPVTMPPKPAPPVIIPVSPKPARVEPQIARPEVPAPVPATKGLESGFAAAQQHNVVGRQLTQAGRYREAVVELTEALRIAPGFALAFNARGFARLMLHDWIGAIEDLNHAIVLNPAYGDAYKIRAIARRAIGDKAGADADAKRSHQLAR
jgi:tetratricopeptide (TPR) repeat protein